LSTTGTQSKRAVRVVADVERLVEVVGLAVATGAFVVFVAVDRRDLLDVELAVAAQGGLVVGEHRLGPGDRLGPQRVPGRAAVGELQLMEAAEGLVGHAVDELLDAVAAPRALGQGVDDRAAGRLVDVVDPQPRRLEQLRRDRPDGRRQDDPADVVGDDLQGTPREAQVGRLERLQEGRALALGVPPVVGQGLHAGRLRLGQEASMSGMRRPRWSMSAAWTASCSPSARRP
jgi:hypothetical protein